MSTVTTRKHRGLDIKKLRRQEMLLGVIYLFSPLHREISIPQIKDSVNQFQKKLHLGYYFSKHLNYSDKLMEDLEDLINEDFLEDYPNGHDLFSPEEKIKLTITGSNKGKESVSQLPVDILEYLEAT